MLDELLYLALEDVVASGGGVVGGGCWGWRSCLVHLIDCSLVETGGQVEMKSYCRRSGSRGGVERGVY